MGTWSFNDALATDKDYVRFLIGDTDPNKQMVSDEGIATMLTMYEDVFESAAALADGLATKFARIASISIDGLTVKGTDRAQSYRILASQLRRQSTESAPGALGIPFVGGVTVSGLQAQRMNTDRTPNRFNMGEDDFPGILNASTIYPYLWGYPT